MARQKKSFSPEYREEAVRLVIETSRPGAQVARERGISSHTLHN
ncbi:transposase [Sinosporangium siamense]